MEASAEQFEGLSYFLFILCRLRGECSVAVLAGCFLERCLEGFAAPGLLFLGAMSVILVELFCRDFVPFLSFLLAPDLLVSDLLLPDTSDTTVPTAVPTFFATAVKASGSALMESFFESLWLVIRYPSQVGSLDASSVNQVATKGSGRQFEVIVLYPGPRKFSAPYLKTLA